MVGIRTVPVLYMAVVRQASSATCQVGLDLEQGPDGRASTPHSTPIAFTSITTTPKLLQGTASDASMLIGEFLHPILKIQDSGGPAAQWAQVQVYEMRKPF